MSLSETGGRLPREKWPFSFDLEGIPREREIRETRLKQLRGESMPDGTITLNHEQAEALREALLQYDRANSNNVFDLSKPPKEPYVYREFPKLVYGKNGHVLTIKSSEEQEKAVEAGYSLEPHPDRDYSRLDRNSMKAPKVEVPAEIDGEVAAEAQADVDAANEKAARNKKKSA